MSDGGGVAETGVGSAQVLGHVGMAHREAADVGLVDDGVGPRDPGRRSPRPVEAVVHHHRERDMAGGVELAPDVVGHPAVPLVAVDLGHPLDRPGESPRVRIDEQLPGVEAAAGGRLVGAVDPVAVAGSRADPEQVAVPGQVGPIRELVDLPRAPVGVDQHQIHTLGVGAEERKVGAVAIPLGTEREVLARPRVARGRGRGRWWWGRSRCRPRIWGGRRRGLPRTRCHAGDSRWGSGPPGRRQFATASSGQRYRLLVPIRGDDTGP